MKYFVNYYSKTKLKHRFNVIKLKFCRFENFKNLLILLITPGSLPVFA